MPNTHPHPTERDRRLEVSFQKDSIEVTSIAQLQLAARQNARSSRYGNPSFDEFEDSISLGCIDDSIVSEGFTTTVDETPMSAAAKRMRRKSAMKWYLRLLLLMIATLIGFFVSGVVYYATRLAEIDTFEQSFAELSQQVVVDVQNELLKKFLALDGLSIALTSHSLNQDQTTFGSWPTTTLPDFTTRATNILAAADSMSIVVAPLVQNDTLGIWESFLATDAGEWRSNAESTPITIEEQRSSIASPLLQDFTTSFRVWQHHPKVPSMINADLLSPPTPSILAFISSHQAIIGNLMPLTIQADDANLETTYPLNQYLSTLLSADATRLFNGSQDLGTLVSNIYYPIFDTLSIASAPDTNRSLVGLLTMDIVWQDFLSGISSIGTDEELICVLRNRCGQEYTFTIQDDRVVMVTEGDFHPVKYDDMVEAVQFDNLDALAQQQGSFQAEMDDFCLLEIKFYPSITLEEQYLTFKPVIYTASAAFCFVIIFILSLAYERRVAQVHESAVQYRAVVANLFPPAVRQRMFRQQEQDSKPKMIRQGSAKLVRPASPNTLSGPSQSGPSTRNSSYTPLTDVNDLTLMPSKPIADHFPNSTILFADIAGFTSWSSQRSPEHVFTLLQSLFNLFDGIAKKRGVFKVETIGDCYLAVTGVPEPQADHALRMTKFARECLYRVRPLLDRLVGSLGAGTSDLAIRIGLHSGPVTAGVLQGEKSRFQLFGDTVNTASRMESNGEPGRIHVSRATADLLTQAHKNHWLEKREDPIHAKGKGLMETYWIRAYKKRRTPKTEKSYLEYNENSETSDSEGFSDSDLLLSSFTSSTSRLSDTMSENSLHEFSRGDGIALYDLPAYSSHHAEKELIEWHVKVLGQYLRKNLHQRNLQGGVTRSPLQGRNKDLIRASCPFDEISETIPMLNQLRTKTHTQTITDPSSVVLPSRVVDQLRDFVTTIAQSYRQNHFHNFARATHTAMFMHKFLQEIHKCGPSGREHDCISAVDSDPQVQFALMLAALIHDADHAGVPNDLLAKEKPDLAKIYKGRLLAEQHALEFSWELLTDKCFEGLHECLFTTRTEMLRFRQIMVNLVLATDQVDKELLGIRALRWEEGFSLHHDMVPGRERIRLKISVFIEILLQTADLSHTMQSWDIYLRWSKKQYLEVHDAYFTGRSVDDPEKTWYAREAFILDRQAIPLAEKLAMVTGWDGLVEKIRSNRQEWIASGKIHVKNFAAEAKVMRLSSKTTQMTFGNGSSNSLYRFTLQDN